MSGYGYRPSYVWYVPKPVNDIERIMDAFDIISEHFEGSIWSENQETFAREIESHGIKFGSGGAMGARNWFSTFKYFGLAYVNKKDKRVTLTEIGKKITNSNRKEIITSQLIRMQYPNPYQGRYVKGVELYPFRVILKVLLHLPDYFMTKEELGLFIMGLKRCNEKNIPEIVKRISEFRKSTPSRRKLTGTRILKKYAKDVIEKFKSQGKNWKTVTPERVWDIVYDYADRHFLTLDYTDICNYDKAEKNLSIPRNQILNIRRMLSDKTLTVEHKFEDEEDWFYFFGALEKTTAVTGRAMSKKQYNIMKMIKVAENMLKESGKINIRTLAETYSLSIDEVKRELQKYGYYNDEKPTTEHNDIILILAKACKKNGFRPHIGAPEQGRDKRLKTLSVPMESNNFGIPDSVFKEVRYMDLLWLSKDRIVKVYEVEEKEIDRELHKISNLIVTSDIKIKFFIVVPDANMKIAERRLNSPSYLKANIHKKVKILSYSDIREGRH